MKLSDKHTHLGSDEHKNHHNKIWCEDCNEYITDKQGISNLRHISSLF